MILYILYNNKISAIKTQVTLNPPDGFFCIFMNLTFSISIWFL